VKNAQINREWLERLIEIVEKIKEQESSPIHHNEWFNYLEEYIKGTYDFINDDGI